MKFIKLTEDATFTDEQPVRLRLKNGELVTAYFRDCEWIRKGVCGEDDNDVKDCFQRGYVGNHLEIELDEIEAWRPATKSEIRHTEKTQ